MDLPVIAVATVVVVLVGSRYLTRREKQAAVQAEQQRQAEMYRSVYGPQK